MTNKQTPTSRSRRVKAWALWDGEQERVIGVFENQKDLHDALMLDEEKDMIIPATITYTLPKKGH